MDILYTISYILCHKFEREGKYQDCPWGFKFLIDEYYDKNFDKCLENYNKLNQNQLDLAKPLKGEVTDKQYGIITISGDFVGCGYITALRKNNIYHDIENNKFYIFDGKNLIEMC